MKRVLLFSTMVMCSILLQERLCSAQKPEFRDELVYILNVFNGKGYTGSFVPNAEDTVYLIADKDNALSATFTLVYFWPTTGRYEASFTTKNEPVEGTLEILKDGKVIKILIKEYNSLHYQEGYRAEESILLKGEEAHTNYEEYKMAMEKYYKEVDRYYKAREEYSKNLRLFLKEMKLSKERGEHLDESTIKKMIPIEPVTPLPPKTYTTPPRKDYIINLPGGKYRMRVKSKDGAIIQGSDKKLVVFTARRSGKTGYEVIPEHRWTKRESWNNPSYILYSSGKNNVYLVPFIQNEYNELFYNKLIDPQNDGRPDKWLWVNIRPLKDITLLILEEGKLIKKLVGAQYYVQQITGSDLGYEIVEYNLKEMPDKKPTFEGYKLELTRTQNKRKYEFQIEKKVKESFYGNTWQVRIVKKEKLYLLYFLSIFPLFISIIVFIANKRLSS